MKRIVVLAVSIILLICPMVMAGPASMPDDLQIVQPDPSLPKEISAFHGKWQGNAQNYEWLVIVEKIDTEKASLYVWRDTNYQNPPLPRGWNRYEAAVTKFGGKYKLVFRGTSLTVKGDGKYLDVDNAVSNPRLIRLP